ncbi:MAG: sugar kinase [Bacteroidota bacterium]
MAKVLSFGELLLRICPDSDATWLAENKLPFYVGGAELNVATALALWEVPSAYFTALPENFMAEQLISYIRHCNIDTTKIYRGGDRIGLYYLPKGKDLKNAGVIYDRTDSAFAKLKTGTLNWDNVLDGITWLHFSAICPALNQAVADVCLEAVKAASLRGVTVSIDLNYRAKLWQYGKQPVEIMPKLVEYADLIMGNIWAAEKMLGIQIPETVQALASKEAYCAQAKKTSEEVMQRFPECKSVANTFRFDDKQGITYYTTLYTHKEFLISNTYQADQILDKVGSGDCFMAGLIYGFYNKHKTQDIIDFATAAAFNKLFIPSDCTTATIADINKTQLQNEH